MFANTQTIKQVAVGLALTAAAATFTASQAFAGGAGSPPLQASHYDGRSPDTKDAAYAAHHGSRATYAALTTNRIASPPFKGPGYDGRSADTKDAALAAHRQTPALIDGRSPDTIDAAEVARANLLTPVDGRSPDTIDAAIQAHAPVVTVIESPGFQWADFGIGIAVTVGVLFLLAASTRLTGRRGRKRQSPVAPA